MEDYYIRPGGPHRDEFRVLLYELTLYAAIPKIADAQAQYAPVLDARDFLSLDMRSSMNSATTLKPISISSGSRSSGSTRWTDWTGRPGMSDFEALLAKVHAHSPPLPPDCPPVQFLTVRSSCTPYSRMWWSPRATASSLPTGGITPVRMGHREAVPMLECPL